MVDPVQNLGDSFSCSIEKVFLCTGADGYVPKYNPTNKEYGCLADAPSLLYRFKILVGYSENRFPVKGNTQWLCLMFLFPVFPGQSSAGDPGQCVRRRCIQGHAGSGHTRWSTFGLAARIRWLHPLLVPTLSGRWPAGWILSLHSSDLHPIQLHPSRSHCG